MDSRERRLSSWKEIAAYLRCDKRTCLRWEKKFGLPVHRLGDSGSRSLVFAYRDELDEWLRARRDKEGNSRLRVRIWESVSHNWLVAALIVLCVASAAVWIGTKKRGNAPAPKEFRVEKSRLILEDVKGNVLGSYDTSHENLWEEARYRKYAFFRRIEQGGARLLPKIIFKDVNGDGRLEILFIIHTYDDDRPGKLVCLDPKGELLWTHEADRRVSFNGTFYPSSEFLITAVDVIEIEGEKRILVIGQHTFEFPSFASLLTPEGRPVSEYWNSGRFLDYMGIDLDGDQKKELLLVGTNNEYKKGFLAALGPGRMSGASPQSGAYQCTSLSRASEKAYILFPRTPIDLIEAEREGIKYLDSSAPDRLNLVATFSHILYRLNFRLEIVDIIMTDSFCDKFRRYSEEGKVPARQMNRSSLQSELRNSILYFDGQRWVNRSMR